MDARSRSAPPAAEDALGGELLEQLGGLRRGLRRATSAPWPGGALTGAQAELLRLLRREPGASVNQAAERLRLAPNTVSALVGQLVDAGLVRRERDDGDRRVVRLELSEEAERWLAAWRDARLAALSDALERLDEPDRHALEGALTPLARLVATLDADGRDDG